MGLSNKLVDREYKATMEAKAILYLPLLAMITILIELENVKNILNLFSLSQRITPVPKDLGRDPVGCRLSI